MGYERIKTEHAGAKNGGGAWMTRDEANLTSAERPKEGETSEIKDTYAYNGENLRTSQTISGTTSYLAWVIRDRHVPSSALVATSA
jgi:hypothetical protein